MTRNWEEFEETSMPSGNEIYASLNWRGEIVLNRRAYELLGRPERITLLYDRQHETIGLRADHERGPNSSRLLPKGESGNRVLQRQRFMENYGIRVTGTVWFHRAVIEDGVLVLDLRQTVRVQKRPKENHRTAGAS